MEKKTLYTAVGHFRRKTEGNGKSYPVVYVNRQEHLMDLQEMTVWTALNWRLLDHRQVEDAYASLARELGLTEYRTLENTLHRLEMRGLVAAGSGSTDFDALYDLLSDLYVIPISEGLPLRTATFFKMVFLDGVPLRVARRLFQRRSLDSREAQVMHLSRQALLSTAELIKCVELGINSLHTEDAVLNALYDDADTTSDNMRYAVQDANCKASVVMAVANLCLHRQIVFERV